MIFKGWTKVTQFKQSLISGYHEKRGDFDLAMQMILDKKKVYSNKEICDASHISPSNVHQLRLTAIRGTRSA